MSDPFSIVKPIGFSIASCGYCLSKNTAHVYGANAMRLTAQDYQDLIDRGWQRSGFYLYKPNARDRLDALAFQPSKHQRKVLGRFNRYIQNEYTPRRYSRGESVMHDGEGDAEGEGEHEDDRATDSSQSPEPRAARASSRTPSSRALADQQSVPDASSSFLMRIHATEEDKREEGCRWRKFRVVLESPVSRQDKKDLYFNYQRTIHKVSESSLTTECFEQNIVHTPLVGQYPTASNQPTDAQSVGHGTYHLCYYIDDRLAALAVLDILPKYISSHYFYYDPALFSLSPGQYSALREIALVKELRATPGFEDLTYYTLGHYIHTNPKMAFKTKFRPSQLLDPETYMWAPLEQCKDILKYRKYSTFTKPGVLSPRAAGLLLTIESEISRKSSASMDLDGFESPAHHDRHQHRKRSLDDTLIGFTQQDEETKRRKSLSPDSARKNSSAFLSTSAPASTNSSLSSMLSVSSASNTYGNTFTPSPPAPGMVNPDDVNESDLAQLVVFQNGQASLLTDCSRFREDVTFVKTAKEHFAALGPDLASRMLIYL
ncbi:Arginyl-tRNA--protein transferase 1 [Actinomortierella ambigua]|nr:Arginyl-tRNA--protein transferase 1 [Actinomortierella ambigua]